MAAGRGKLHAWLGLLRLPRTRNEDRCRLLKTLGEPVEWIFSRAALNSASLRSGGVHAPWSTALRERITALDWPAIDSDAVWLARTQTRLLTLLDAAYPALLREIESPPIVLFYQGSLACLSAPAIAVVGSRRPTGAGREAARGLGKALAQAGTCVVSGLALGVDAAAHQGALDASGCTAAVLGSGHANLYPARNRGLAQRIAECGVVLSEFAPHVPPTRYNFPHRNRIISGLSLGVAVIEAAQRSGSLITARLAGEQGRDVFAMPGSVRNPLSRGCHQLLREGATLIESAADVLAEIGHEWAGPNAGGVVGAPGVAAGTETVRPRGARSELGPAAAVLACVDFDPSSVDAIVARSGLTPDIVSSMLLALELEGQVRRDLSGAFSLT